MMNTEVSNNRIKYTDGDSDKLIAFVLHQGEEYLERNNAGLSHFPLFRREKAAIAQYEDSKK